MKSRTSIQFLSQKQLLIFIICGTILSCTNNSNPNVKQNEPNNLSTPTNQQQTEEDTEEDTEEAKVSFKVNGIQANTKKGKGNDDEAQLGMFNMMTNSLTFDLLGDEASRPHRGWLHFTINNFSLQAANYTLAGDNSASFTRYETENAGGGVDYNAGNYPNASGSQLSIQFTEIVKNEDASIGEEYLATGTFTLKLVLSETAKNDLKSIDITEGRFEKVPIRILGKKS